MIPAETVEAAAREWVGEQVWQDCDYAWRADYLERAQRVLEAAAPYLMAEAWDRAAASIVDEHGNPIIPTNVTNPYRSQS